MSVGDDARSVDGWLADARLLPRLLAGRMCLFKQSLDFSMSLNSDAVNRIRLMTIATDTKPPGAWGGFAFNEWTCGQLNWNGECRPEVFQAYPTLWWVENDWAYTAMFTGGGGGGGKEKRRGGCR